MLTLAIALSLQSAGGITLEPVWRTGGFDRPESVAWSDETGFFYVSNVAGGPGEADGDGFIARVTPDGEIETLRWAEAGLSAPKGMAIANGHLYVTDIDAIAVFDLETGAPTGRHPVESAGFLNDALALEDGSILVSDSRTGRIHRLAGGEVTLWLEDPLLAAINGLMTHEGDLYVITMSDRFMSVDMETRDITVRAEGVGNGDGIVPVSGGRWLASEWPGRLFLIDADGSVTTIEDTREAGIYMNDFILIDGQLVMAHMSTGEVSARHVRDMN